MIVIQNRIAPAMSYVKLETLYEVRCEEVKELKAKIAALEAEIRGLHTHYAAVMKEKQEKLKRP